jgi:hypothetical protein
VRVIFDRVPPNLRARPTLSVTVESSRGGTRPASLRYLTPGLDWSADYVTLYDDAKGTIDMQGWVTLTNNTGTTFHSANTLLVAGNPNSGGGSRVYRGGYSPPPPPGRAMVPGTETANREQLGDFYLYPIGERTTIANNQTKQVSFLDVQGVPARKVYGRTVGWLSSDSLTTAPATMRPSAVGPSKSGASRFVASSIRRCWISSITSTRDCCASVCASVPGTQRSARSARALRALARSPRWHSMTVHGAPSIGASSATSLVLPEPSAPCNETSDTNDRCCLSSASSFCLPTNGTGPIGVIGLVIFELRRRVCIGMAADVSARRKPASGRDRWRRKSPSTQRDIVRDCKAARNCNVT